MRFELLKTDGGARGGRLSTPHGVVETPAFMPVGTQGSVKSLTPEDLRQIGTQILLANTYHLFLRPGHRVIAELGGLHRFMAWEGPILTDSGGFQVYSLASLGKVTEEGVRFRSHLDGAEHLLTPELSVEIQQGLGADIIHPLDECLAHPAPRAQTEASLALTLRWTARAKAAHSRGDRRPALFGVVPGGGVRRVPHRRPRGGGAEAAHARPPGIHRGAPAQGSAALLDGGWDAAGSPGCGGLRCGPVRLRASHPQRPERPALHGRRRPP